MAVLNGKDFRGRKWFSITPNPSQHPDIDALEYLVEFGSEKEAETFTRVYSVAGWQTEHFSVWMVAKCFKSVSSITGKRIHLGSEAERYTQPAHLYENTGWIRVVLWGYERLSRVGIQFYIQEDDRADIFRSFFLQANIDEVEQFGAALEEEIIAASPRWAKECI